MDGPPISMFSIMSSNVAFGLSTVSLNGYRFTTTMSIFFIFIFSSCAICSGTSLLASRPACMFGCNVFTLPSSISGKPVTSDIPTVLMPFRSRSVAVPPVDITSTPIELSSWANSIDPFLVRDTDQSTFDLDQRYHLRIKWQSEEQLPRMNGRPAHKHNSALDSVRRTTTASGSSISICSVVHGRDEGTLAPDR